MGNNPTTGSSKPRKKDEFPKLHKAEKIANNLQCNSPEHLKLNQQKIHMVRLSTNGP